MKGAGKMPMGKKKGGPMLSGMPMMPGKMPMEGMPGKSLGKKKGKK